MAFNHTTLSFMNESSSNNLAFILGARNCNFALQTVKVTGWRVFLVRKNTFSYSVFLKPVSKSLRETESNLTSLGPACVFWLLGSSNSTFQGTYRFSFAMSAIKFLSRPAKQSGATIMYNVRKIQHNLQNFECATQSVLELKS